jgi:hypothetical protein
MDYIGQELYNHIDQCKNVEELKSIHRQRIAQIQNDYERVLEIEKQVDKLNEEARVINYRNQHFKEDFESYIARKIGELVLSEQEQ